MSEILLESGTGEVEILEFIISGRFYAINVIKVKEVLDIQSMKITKIPLANPAIAGLILNRGEVVTLIDLKYVLDQEKTENWTKVIICEFNQLKVAFTIDDITSVHRIKWEQILKPETLSADSLVTGNIILGDKLVLFLDFEKIVTDISPNTGINEHRIANIQTKDRSEIKILLADDSPLIRALLRDTLTKTGFQHLNIFDDGKQLLDHLLNLFETKGENFIEDVQLVITDIEMPTMDGHTLTRRIKEHSSLNKLPVIIFSSLITDDLKHKGVSVGADAQLSKPEIGELINTVDQLLLKN
ncbi:response regulator receiver modulated CheW protein [Syntrophobotulus glycolicus DSM 8271]|uniref:Stage 0 sporulation protein A homolog n=1 Tax=Syntrophobotulus glycolicus (strain DSM 8271 / FlGlyR) TaxID=645991 RepID=F0SYB2_SYNGF|nr:response regulator receiver modulated CheW protein [Syntrophobotulus glycolicus DSM 8271]